MNIQTTGPLKLSATQKKFLQEVIDAMPQGIQVFRAVRDNSNRIMDFEYVMINREAIPYTEDKNPAGNTLLSLYPGCAEPFERLTEVTTTGIEMESIHYYPTSRGVRCYSVRYKKFGDGVLLAHEDITDYKLSEEERRNSIHLLEQIAQSSPDVFYIADLDQQRIIFITEQVKHLMGLGPEEIMSRSFDIFPGILHIDDYSLREQQVEQLLNTSNNEPVEAEMRARVNRNSYRWFRFRERVFKRHADGSPSQILGIITDIHEWKQAALTSEHHEQQWQTLINNIPDIIVRFDRKLKFVFANKTFLSLLQLSEEKLYGRDFLEINKLHEGNMEFIVLLRKVFLTGQPESINVTYLANNEPRYINTTVIPERDNTGKIVTLLTVGHDITAERIKDIELKRSESKRKEDIHFIQQIADTTPDILYILDLHTQQIVYSNRQIAADLGYTQQEIMDMKNPVFDIMHEADIPLMHSHLQQIKTIKDNSLLEIEYRMKKPDGSINWFLDRDAVFKRNKKGVPVEKIGIAQNITTRKLQEEQAAIAFNILQQAEDICGLGSWEYTISTRQFKWSEGMYRLFNIRTGTVVSPQIYKHFVVPDQQHIVEKILYHLETLHLSFDEQVTIIRGKETKTLKIKGVPIKDKSDHPIKMVGVNLDISVSQFNQK